MHPRDAILLAITAAAEAWRAGEHDVVATVTSRMAAVSASSHVRLPLALLSAIQAASSTISADQAVEIRWAVESAPPLVAMQIAALAGLDQELHRTMDRIFRMKRIDFDSKLEVLSTKECIKLMNCEAIEATTGVEPSW